MIISVPVQQAEWERRGVGAFVVEIAVDQESSTGL
jgi:hypothetical protein